VEAIGRSVLDHAREKLFDPLGIDTVPAAEPLAVIENLPVYEAASFAWPVDPQGLHVGHTYLKINAPDMAKIGQLMLDDGRWDGEQIVLTQWVTESTRAQVATSGGSTGDYGYQWWVTTATVSTLLWPSGSAVSSSRSSPTFASSWWFPARSPTSPVTP
jgi:CubicO group peptidase (beta-lactamase class C family)